MFFQWVTSLTLRQKSLLSISLFPSVSRCCLIAIPGLVMSASLSLCLPDMCVFSVCLCVYRRVTGVTGAAGHFVRNTAGSQTACDSLSLEVCVCV